MAWPGINQIRQRILRLRRLGNRNNVTRTYYYATFWSRHPEVPWALLAHLVSRNAGYQMSDLKRYKLWKDILAGAAIGGLSPTTVPTLLVPILSNVATSELQALFALLEAGNFLIFHDVMPQLEVYSWAKQFPDHKDEVYRLLVDERQLEVDEFIFEEWERFFFSAQTAGWSTAWSNEWQAGTDIQRHSFALIINEQNQIEDRLVNDSHNRYLRSFGTILGPHRIIDLVNRLELTKLAFPLAATTQEINPATALLVYTVLQFRQVNARIQTGRDLYAGLFQNPRQRTRIKNWAVPETGRNIHAGTRKNYNSNDYDVDLLSLVPSGDTYSPPLTYFEGEEPAWPFSPGSTPRFRHLHQIPIRLPKSVRTRFSSSIVNTFMSPLSTPIQPLLQKSLDEQFEILI